MYVGAYNGTSMGPTTYNGMLWLPANLAPWHDSTTGYFAAGYLTAAYEHIGIVFRRVTATA